MIAACPLPWPRGTPIRIHRMAEALQAAGHEVHVATYPMGQPSTPVAYTLHRVAPTRLSVGTAPGPSSLKLAYLDPLLYRLTRRITASRQFDVIHAHHIEGLLIAAAAMHGRRQIPLVFDCHTLLGMELPHYRLPIPGSWRAWLGFRVDRLLPRRADHVIAVSDYMREWFVEQAAVAPEDVSLIPNGVEHEHFGSIALALDPAGGEPTVTFAGNLAEYQTLDFLFQAFRQTRLRLRGAKLVLVTDSTIEHLRPRLAELGIEESVMALPSDYAALPHYLARADVLANPRVECSGVPQKVLNYMAAGRGIVSFDSSRGPLRDGSTALVVPDGDVDAFAAAMLHLLENPAVARSLGDNARREAVARHGWDRVATDVVAVYRRLAGGRT